MLEVCVDDESIRFGAAIRPLEVTIRIWFKMTFVQLCSSILIVFHAFEVNLYFSNARVLNITKRESVMKLPESHNDITLLKKYS